YLLFLGHQQISLTAVLLGLSVLRSFYKFLARCGIVENFPIKGIAMPKAPRRLPRFLTAEQMLALLRAPVHELDTLEKAGEEVSATVYHRDAALLETIYSCGLRVSELCGLLAEDINWDEQLVRVRGKGKKERQLPIGAHALEAIRSYWNNLAQAPVGAMPVFLRNPERLSPMYPRLIQLRLKRYLEMAGMDPQLTPH